MVEEKKKKIAIIEDDLFLLGMYITKLKSSNFEVISKQDGEEGLSLIREEKPDLVLLDILLPEMSGLDVLAKVKKDSTTQNIPVILLTNVGQREAVEKGLSLGAMDYLIKAHVTPTEVVNKVKKALEKK